LEPRSILFLVIGFVALVLGADLAVRAAVALARRLGVSTLVIGLTLVALGTSAPELVVAIAAVMHGSSDIVMGNVVGSNVANIGLILGVAGLLAPIVVARSILKREGPFLIAITALWFLLTLDLVFGRADAAIYLGALIIGGVLYVRSARGEIEASSKDIDDNPWSYGKISLVLLFGLAILVGGGELLVSAAIDIARDLGVSERVIGLTIVALGTSLPELATSVIAALRGHADMSIGNVIGSNIMNLLLILGVAGMLHPIDVAERFQTIDVPLSLFLALLLLLLARKGRLGRLSGATFLSIYLGYMLATALGG
jgi:cation:H+ antiporter